MPMHLVCPDCGIIHKSGKRSCCGHGGSWFGKCGISGHENNKHTWSEGIRACKVPLSKGAVGQQLHASQAKSNTSSDKTSMGTSLNVVIVTAHMLASTPPDTLTPITMRTNTSITTSVRKPRTTYEENSASSTTIAHTSAETSVPKPTIPPINPAIKPSVSPIIASLVNPTIMKLMPTDSSDQITTTLSYASASTSMIVREYDKLLYVVTHIGIAILIDC